MDASRLAPRVPVCRPHLFGLEEGYVLEALRSTQISGTGNFIERMEALVAEAAGTRYAVAVSSGTSAIDLALEELRPGPGDEVIVPNFCMFAPIAALLRRGVKVVPVDADDTWNMDPDEIEAALTPKTRGIMMVHTYGHPADALRICDIAKRNGLWVLEDAAEALGATLEGRPAGSFGDIAVFSFYANKVVTTGEGGALVTNDAATAEHLRDLRNLCFGQTWSERFVHHRAGYNARLSNMLAAFGCAQLPFLGRALEEKRSLARRYRERLEGIPGLILPPESPRALNSYWVFGVLLPEHAVREAFADRLLKAGIETRPFFHPVSEQPCTPIAHRDFPRTARLSRRGIYLPSFVGMPDGDFDRVIEGVRANL